MNAIPQQIDFDSSTKLVSEVELVLVRIRLRARLRAEWLRNLWREERESGTQGMITHSEAEAILEDRDSPEQESAWLTQSVNLVRERNELNAIEETLQTLSPSRLREFAHIFGLNRSELDLFQLCLAYAIDSSLGRLFAYLNDQSNHSYVTETLAARLFNYGRCGLWSSESALFRWQLLHEQTIVPGEPSALVCDSLIRDWFLNRPSLDRMLVGISHLQSTQQSLKGWPVEETASWIQETIRNAPGIRVRITIVGANGSGRSTFAANVAKSLRLPLLVMDTDAIEEADWRTVFVRAQRQAFLDRCALAWTGESLSRRNWSETVLWFPIQFVIAEPGKKLSPRSNVVERTIPLPGLSMGERKRLWEAYIPIVRDWPEKRFRQIVRQYPVTVREIASAAQQGLIKPSSVTRFLRESAQFDLGSLAQRLECPFGWNDLVVPLSLRQTLEDILHECKARNAFWEKRRHRRLFPQGRGLLALFSGSPGTGKTMAVQVLAARLGFDLYRIDLSSLVSKFVGETSQNIERLLRRAADRRLVLLFDEADTLFGKRNNELRDAQDHYVNMDAGHLMMAIESYPGIAVLATNLKNNIDPAFVRRLRYVVDFPRPDASQRFELWHRMVEGLCPKETVSHLERDLRLLAENIEATGSQIKFAILSAIFMARRAREKVGISHLLRGLNQELQKEGRSVSVREQERLLQDVD